MKDINLYINEKLVIGDNLDKGYNYYPKTKEELRKILAKRLAKDEDANLNDIDVSAITDMSNLFRGLNPHYIDISEWDVSNVTKMNCMFYECKYFNCNLSNWNVSNVENMSWMFAYCPNLNCNFQNWKINNKCITTYMFHLCYNITTPTWYK